MISFKNSYKNIFSSLILAIVISVPENTAAESVPALIGADAKNYLIVDLKWLASNLDNKYVVIIDARSAASYKKNHIKNAINIPVAKTFSTFNPKDRVASTRHIQTIFGNAGINSSSNIVIYDNGEFINAGRIFWVLEVYGHRRTAVLNYGFPGWVQESLPTSVKAHKLPAKQFIAEIQPSRLKTKLHTRLAIEDQNKIIIDVRSTEEFLGKKSKSRRAGHIPGAISIPWHMNFKKENGISSIRTMSELKFLYRDIDKGKKIITYCNKGRHSSFSYLILRQLGRDVSHYDGSWFEWGNDFSLPIEVGSK